MKLSSVFATLAVAALAACADRAEAPPKPTSLRVVAGDAQAVAAGLPLASSPTFAVLDERGSAITGVAVTVAVASGGGSLTAAPTKTTGPATSVGTWTLGRKAGPNQLTVQVAGIATPLTITANGLVGAAAKITPTTSLTLTGRVAELVAPGPSGTVTDAFDNAIAGAAVTVSIANGGTGPSALTADANGRVDVAGWTLGTVAGPQTLTLTSGAATATFIATAAPGDPTQLTTLTGDEQSGPAGAVLPQPIVLRLVDRFGNGVGGRDAQLAVTAGGGSLSDPAPRSAADGSITISSWTLGKSAVPQTMRATVGTFVANLSAQIRTDYHIDVRFYGPPMTDAQRALFTNAAARLSAIVTGDVPDTFLPGLNASSACGVSGLPFVNEPVDDLLIFASVRDIDGPKGILAQAGPCVLRSGAEGFLAAVGVMEFDAADIALMAQQGTLQDVITHEMLHILGIGTIWSLRALVRAEGTPNVAYFGAEGTKGCVGSGGSLLCAASVPVENTGGPGTADSHWREATFRSELMTGFVNLGGMPLSQITIGSLGDMGYLVNPFAADPFQIPGTASLPALVPDGAVWERSLPSAVVLDGNGGARFIKRP